MRFLGRSLTGLFLLSVTVGLLAWAGGILFGSLADRANMDRPGANARERSFTVNVVTGIPAQVTPVLSVFGEVRSAQTLELRAAASGRVIELSDDFVEGGEVEEGTVLIRIDPAQALSNQRRANTDLEEAISEERDALAARDLAEEDLAAAMEQASLRNAILTRQQDLKARGVGTDAAVETAELSAAAARQAVINRRQALQQAVARVDQAATRRMRQALAVEDAERILSDTTIRAAFSGKLDDVRVVRGGLVQMNEQLATLVDPDALEVSFRVSTAQFARLLDLDGNLIGAPLRIRLGRDADSLTAVGVITREGARTGEGLTGRLLFADLQSAAGFRPGDFVLVEIEEPPLDNVAVLPATALDSAGQVLIVNDENRLEVRQVELLRRQGDDVIVKAAPVAGHSVVTNRSPLLGEGILVRPLGSTQTSGDLIELSNEKRAELVALVEANQRLTDDARGRMLNQLREPMVPRRLIERIETRMGG